MEDRGRQRGRGKKEGGNGGSMSKIKLVEKKREERGKKGNEARRNGKKHCRGKEGRKKGRRGGMNMNKLGEEKRGKERIRKWEKWRNKYR